MHRCQYQYQSQYQELYMYDDLNKIKKDNKKNINRMLVLQERGGNSKSFVDKINNYEILFSRSEFDNAATIDINNSKKEMVLIMCKNR